MTLTERAAILGRARLRGYRPHPDYDHKWYLAGDGPDDLIDEDELIELQLVPMDRHADP